MVRGNLLDQNDNADEKGFSVVLPQIKRCRMRPRLPVVIGAGLMVVVGAAVFWVFMTSTADTGHADRIIGVWEDVDIHIRTYEYRKDDRYLTRLSPQPQGFKNKG